MPSAAPPRVRTPVTFSRAALYGAVLSLLIVAVAGALYFRFVRYERVAAHHVPEGSVLALRLDVQQAVLYEPFRKHFLPLFGGPSLAPEEGDARLARIERASGFSRGDLREVVVVRGPTRGDWAIVLGGIFRSRATTGTLASALAAEEPLFRLASDGRAVVHEGSGVAVGRAPDGVVVIGATRASFDRAARPSAPAALAVPSGGGGGFVLGPTALMEVASHPRVIGAGELPALLSGMTALKGSIEIGERLALVLTGSSKDPSIAGRAATQALAILRGFSRADGSWAARFARAGADRATLSPEGAAGSRLELAWEREEVDQAFASLAEAIRSGFR